MEERRLGCWLYVVPDITAAPINIQIVFSVKYFSELRVATHLWSQYLDGSGVEVVRRVVVCILRHDYSPGTNPENLNSSVYLKYQWPSGCSTVLLHYEVTQMVRYFL